MFWMIFVFQYAMTKAKAHTRTFLIFVFGFGLACQFLTFSRSSWLATLVILLVLFYLYPRTTAIMTALAIPFLFAAVIIFPDEFAFAETRLNTTETIEARRVLAHAGERMFLAEPLFGWGYGSYDLYDWQFMERVSEISPSPWDLEKGTSHNTYITTLAEMGAIGFFFYIFPMAYWFWQTIKVFPRIPREGFCNRNWLILLWGYTAFYAVIAQAIDFRFFWYSQVTVWLTLGLIAVIITQYSKKNMSY
jgi:O-antigen ligase